ncbi:YceI family protein [Formosa maritima]|uniref:YceI family protein n=1 Tax=Formosa maritima TaxID=2592046 RepID=A0A5D0GFG4_9FLAO|nr:YceI family protein [Formosa maritima]TYA57531.1 YceI family protein [Formosa maritima]
MKTRFFTILTIATMTVFFTSCKDKAKEAETTEATAPVEKTEVSTKYIVNTDGSTIMWTGHKPTGSHNGTISLESGVLTMNNDVLESGTFLINMNSINVMDIPVEDEKHAKLTGHLKSPDFFDVEKFPASAFEVTGIVTTEGKTMLSGNLKMKDTINNITIPVTITKNGDTLDITSETFTIDRSKWNVQYGSKSFFDNLGDKFINDDIELQIKVTSTKA